MLISTYYIVCHTVFTFNCSRLNIKTILFFNYVIYFKCFFFRSQNPDESEEQCGKLKKVLFFVFKPTVLIYLASTNIKF